MTKFQRGEDVYIVPFKRQGTVLAVKTWAQSRTSYATRYRSVLDDSMKMIVSDFEPFQLEPWWCPAGRLNRNNPIWGCAPDCHTCSLQLSCIQKFGS